MHESIVFSQGDQGEVIALYCTLKVLHKLNQVMTQLRLQTGKGKYCQSNPEQGDCKTNTMYVRRTSVKLRLADLHTVIHLPRIEIQSYVLGDNVT